MVEDRGRVATKGTAIAGAESVVASSRGSSGGSNPGIAFRQRGKSKRTKLRVARAARSYLLALARTRTPGWPGVLPWIRRSRLDIDKWLAEGEPNTTLLLHMQGHPFVRTWVRGKREDKNFDCHAFLDHNQRNKVHFHGITISSNWHLQQHRDTETQGENSVQGMRANRKYQAAASFPSSFFLAFVATLLRLATVLLPSTSLRSRRPPAAFHLPCPFSFKRELDSVLFFLYFSLIPKHPSITNFDVWRSKKSSLEHSRSITLFVLLEPSFRPFHFASTPETSEVGDPQKLRNRSSLCNVDRRNYEKKPDRVMAEGKRKGAFAKEGVKTANGDGEREREGGGIKCSSFSFANSDSYRRDHNDDDGKKTTKKFVISLDPQSGMEDQSGRWRRSRKEKDEDIEDGTTGLGRFDGKSRLWRDEADRRKGVAACLQILYRVLQPPIRRFPRSPAALALTTTSTLYLHPPLKRADGLG
ncbi:hypothetical protein ALC57_05996 [Trachymyrmex cornetzi]|uniref:Uncharacterized protein n=1 Tax=Trachymyrmex cornetzi TaxID=471704 RepID=A0A151J978_9HYME|nr:hypothetical protein ALC57_05996 [Trachymyrmex cornetzi]